MNEVEYGLKSPYILTGHFGDESFPSLVVSLVLTKLDYGNEPVVVE